MSHCTTDCSCHDQPQTKLQPLSIELLYLDNEHCSRCAETERNLNEAIQRTTPVLEALGREAQLTAIHVESEESARELRLRASPTIRIDGRDMLGADEETPCAPCSELADGAAVTCRAWSWRGEGMDEPPVGLLVEEILRAALDAPQSSAESPAEDAAEGPFCLPKNLARYFAARKGEGAHGCC
ncbi:DUF2703 domain-containing protein [Magnetofaba australis]|uniref:Putative Ferredoxin n=1 Tax=Magnetofaba australis IT-1 TaxID=1434232 RepID=A0A1Y2K050_9PROT|nr:DUF2703 domain-containing protein [Magnetofaba australis]OSM01398.1 putative Ferredoxin [Magnetofaba australis IT-1]